MGIYKFIRSEIKAYRLYLIALESVDKRIMDVWGRIRRGYYLGRCDFSLNHKDDLRIKVAHERSENLLA